MNIELKAIKFVTSDNSTIRQLYLNGTFFGYTLEDRQRILKDLNNDGDFDDPGEGKVYGKTAIPEGTYEVKLTYSPRFKKNMPEIMNVKGFKGVRIHIGNTPEDTEGCLLVGLGYKTDFVTSSKLAFERLMEQLNKADKITITLN